jgi:hypothetical protein
VPLSRAAVSVIFQIGLVAAKPILADVRRPRSYVRDCDSAIVAATIAADKRGAIERRYTP